MKFKTTRKQITQGFECIYLGYCEAQHLLKARDPQAYTAGVYGWNADIYIEGRKAIVTGYRPFGREPMLSYEEIQNRDKEAERILCDYKRPWEERKSELEALYRKFIEEV